MQLKSLKILPLLTFSLSATAGDDLFLQALSGHNQQVKKYSLSQLIKRQAYTVTCHIVNENEHPVSITLSPRLLPSTYYQNVRFNQQVISNNRIEVIPGNGQLSFDILVDQEDAEQYNQLKISSSAGNSFEIDNCVASPMNKKQAGEVSPRIGGFFNAYNDTNQKVTISVGDFFPTKYEIKPHDYRVVIVSTDNQAIHIVKIG